MYMFLTILVVCAIYSVIMIPIERMLRKRIRRRGTRLLVNFVISFAILFALYSIAGQLGFEI